MAENMFHKLQRHIDPVGMCDSPLETMSGYLYQKAINDSLKYEVILPNTSNLEHITSKDEAPVPEGKDAIYFKEALGKKDYAVEAGSEITVLRFLSSDENSIKYDVIHFDSTYILNAVSQISFSNKEDGKIDVKVGNPSLYSKKTNRDYQGNIKETLRTKINEAMNNIIYHNTTKQ